ncbi:MAG TPA: ASKHA domain-containing protein [Candidatus Lokiarchaeia archaeon]|nr:ASKHA domain-containing protein [Candidatus Lokiarchaeia archaeon]
MAKIIVAFQPEGKRVQLEPGTTLLSAAIKGGVDLTSICSGQATCGKCRIIVEDPTAVNEITEEEVQRLSQAEIEKGVRLACCTKPNSDLTVKIPETSRTGKQQLQVEGIETPIQLEPNVKKYYLEIEIPTLEDAKSDVDRLVESLQNAQGLPDLQVNFNLIKELAKKLRDYDWKFTAVVWKNQIIDIEPADTASRIFGYAVDIGTTKLAGYLIDLTTGIVVSAGSLMNPQIPYGEDVIARLNHPDQNKLQEVVCEGIDKILEELVEKTGVKREEIYEMTVVGNTVMHHIFLGIYPLYLGRSPYPPVVRNTIVIPARDLKITINPNGPIVVLPTIAGFVGADTVGVVLATEVYKKDEMCVALDIGTNTEIVLGNKEKLLAVSCASGPAFEGAHIQFGMRAASGAIEKVEIDPETLEAKYTTIDNEPPIGMCGSGMIDLVAEMLKAGIIDVGGIINQNLVHPRVREKDGLFEYVVVPASESGTQEDITFTQRDVSQIVLAKAAIHSGFKLLFKRFNLKNEDIQTLYVAGAFGSHINKESARMIGIFPEIDLNKIIVVGNAAGTGARMCLVSEKAEILAEQLSKTVQYLELGIDPDFQKVFLNSNIIPYADLDEFPEMSQKLKELGKYPENPPPKF